MKKIALNIAVDSDEVNELITYLVDNLCSFECSSYMKDGKPVYRINYVDELENIVRFIHHIGWMQIEITSNNFQLKQNK